MSRKSWSGYAPVEATLEMLASALRDLKGRLRQLFAQERTVSHARLFLGSAPIMTWSAPWRHFGRGNSSEKRSGRRVVADGSGKGSSPGVQVTLGDVAICAGWIVRCRGVGETWRTSRTTPLRVAVASPPSIPQSSWHTAGPARCRRCPGTGDAARRPPRARRHDRTRPGSPQPLPQTQRTSPHHGNMRGPRQVNHRWLS
jgi:hypothetical protein